jgi:glycosyltransferase involved in cell wall biosynthesis
MHSFYVFWLVTSIGSSRSEIILTIKALCIIEDPDRPTIATFIGMHRAGIELSIVCPQRHYRHDELMKAGLNTIPITFKGRYDPKAIRLLREELDKGKYDILHILGNRALLNGLVATRGLDIRIVVYRGIVGNVSFFNPISWMRVLNPRIDRIICVADAVRASFLKMRPKFLRISPKRLVTIHKGHSLDWYTNKPANLQDFGIPRGAFVVGCVATYRPRKGIEILVEAMAGLPDDWNVHLILIGDMNSQKLDKKILKSSVIDRIHRVGYVKDATPLTAACDVFVMPSIKREGLARSVIEAMVYRVPTIVTNCGGSPELVVDGVTGIVVPIKKPSAINNAIRRMYQNPDMRRRMGEAARQRIKNTFRIQDTLDKTIDLYRNVLSE